MSISNISTNIQVNFAVQVTDTSGNAISTGQGDDQ